MYLCLSIKCLVKLQPPGLKNEANTKNHSSLNDHLMPAPRVHTEIPMINSSTLQQPQFWSLQPISTIMTIVNLCIQNLLKTEGYQLLRVCCFEWQVGERVSTVTCLPPGKSQLQTSLTSLPLFGFFWCRVILHWQNIDGRAAHSEL